MQTAVYRAPVYEPTVDELETLKKLELGEDVSLWSAAKEYLSRRLLERGAGGAGRRKALAYHRFGASGDPAAALKIIKG